MNKLIIDMSTLNAFSSYMTNVSTHIVPMTLYMVRVVLLNLQPSA